MTQENNTTAECLHLYQHLAELQHLLSAKGMVLGADKWLAAHDLILFLQNSHQQPQRPEELRNILAPLFCQSPEDQATFRSLFDLWAGEKAASLEALETVDPKSITVPPVESPPVYTLKRVWVGFLMICTLLIYSISEPFIPGGNDTNVTDERAITPGGNERGREPDTSSSPEILVEPTPDGLKPKPTDFRSIPEPVRLNEQQRYSITRWKGLVIAMPMLLWLLFWGYRKVNQRYVLSQESRQQGNPLVYLKLKITKSMPFALGNFSSALRQSLLHTTRKINPEKTIIATIRNAGLFKAVMQQRYFQPEYLVLIDKSHNNDQCAALAESLLTRLKLEHLHTHAYYFQGDPRWGFPVDQYSSQQQAIGLKNLAHKYADCRLLVISDGTKIADSLTGELPDWISVFEAWPQRVWLTSQVQPWGNVMSQIALSGFAVAPLSSSGVQSSALWFAALQTGKSSATGVWYGGQHQQHYPQELKDKDFWLEEEPEKQHRKRLPGLLTQLQDYLGDDAMQLLACVAAYPEINGNLSIALEQKLFVNAHPVQREQRLLRLSALPWCEQGKMPAYLRAGILDRLSKKAFKHIGQIYQDLFELGENAKSGLSVVLPGQTNSKGFEGSTRDSRFSGSDPLLIKALNGCRSRLDFVLPNKLARALGKVAQTSGFKRSIPIMVLIISISFWAGWPYFQQYRESQVLTDLLQQNQRIGVLIEADRSTEAFASVLSESLSRWGFAFQETTVNEEEVKLNGLLLAESPEVVSLIQARIDYLSPGLLKLSTPEPTPEQLEPPSDIEPEIREQIDTVVRIQLPTRLEQQADALNPSLYLVELYAQRDFLLALLNDARNSKTNYETVLLQELLPRLIGSTASMLREIPDSQLPELYAGLKAYLMIHQPQRRDTENLMQWWSAHWPEDNDNSFAQMAIHLQNLISSNFEAPLIDRQLVSELRKTLLQMPESERIYRDIRSQDQNSQEVDLTQKLGMGADEVFRLDVTTTRALTIPSIFTKEKFLAIDFDSEVIRGANEHWVLDDKPAVDFVKSDLDSLSGDILKLYLNEYADVWRSVMNNLQILDFTNEREGLRLLSNASLRDDSPLFSALQLISENTNLAAPNVSPTQQIALQQNRSESLLEAFTRNLDKVVGSPLKQEFGELITFTEIGNESRQRLEQTLNGIEVYMRELYSYANPADKAFNDLKSSYSEKGQVLLASAKIDAVIYPEPLRRWILGLSYNSIQVVTHSAKQHIEQNWLERVVQPYRANIASRYPIESSASEDVPMQDLMDFYGESGPVDAFLTELVLPFIQQDSNAINRLINGQSLDFSAEFLRVVEDMQRIKTGIFQLRKKPDKTVEFRPVSLDASTARFSMTLFGQSIAYSHGPRLNTKISFDFFNPEGQVSVEFRQPNGSILAQTYQGQWGWFRMLQSNKLEPRKNQSQWLTLTPGNRLKRLTPSIRYEVRTLAEQTDWIFGNIFQKMHLPETIWGTVIKARTSQSTPTIPQPTQLKNK